MLQETSVQAFVQNEESGLNEQHEKTILEIFRFAGEGGLTTNEMLEVFHEWSEEEPDTSPYAQVMNASLNNNLKGRRTELTNRGLIREVGKRQCKVTTRKVMYFVYVGEELSRGVQLFNELARVQAELNRLREKELKLLNALDLALSDS